MTSDQLRRWVRHRRLQLAVRAVLAVAWVTAIVLAVRYSPACVPEDPSVCGHPPAEGSFILTLLTPLLLLLTPHAGYVTSLVVAACELGWDVGVERWAVGLTAVVTLVGGGVVAWSRRRQLALAATAEHATLDAPALPDEGRAAATAGRRLLVAAVLAMGSLTCALWYVHDAGALARRERDARREVTTVVGVDESLGRIFVALDPAVAIPVHDQSAYGVADPVTVLAAQDGDHLWIRPVGEPEGASYPLGYAAGLATLALVWGGGAVQRSRAHRRLREATQGIPMLVLLYGNGDTTILATPWEELAFVGLEPELVSNETGQSPAAIHEPAVPEVQERGDWEPAGWEPEVAPVASPPAPASAMRSALLVGDLALDRWAGLIVQGRLLLPRRRVRAVQVRLPTRVT